MASRAVADDELLIDRVFAAPPDLVFAMWASARHFKAWLGPVGFTCTQADLDFREGGDWSATMVSAQHGEARMGGRYLEIEPDRRIVMTFRWLNGEPDPETVVTLTFTPVDGGTLQSFHQTPFENVPRRDSHVGGWSEAFDSERAYLETQVQEPVQ
ncbi:SRPBCC domain-containing protein [Phenylobacterium sp.]|uniref:SRPBCC family protein n=1 Tax=Phenylobacterium sp. TaxID=1871053 RepID=UPI0025E3819B|nr:SRPBCC domain-containing protein [Phenylobacterium sp.]